LAGRVFKSYNPEVHRIPSFDIPYHWPVWTAVDPHNGKPNAVLFLTVSPKGIKYVCNEIYARCGISDLGDEILSVEEQYNVINRLADTSIQEEDWGRVSARQMLEDKGIQVKLAQKKNLKKSGITLINQLFQDNELFVMDHCKRTHREFVNQIYKKKKGSDSKDSTHSSEEVEKKFDDMTDCLRYILVENPGYSGLAEVKKMGPAYERR
jgi:hypothetical protein